MIFRFLAVVLVAAAILGGSAYFAYDLFWKPRLLEAQEKQRMEFEKSQPPPPHPGIAAFQGLAEKLKTASPSEGQALIETFLEQYPDAPGVSEARRVLGALNARELFSPLPGEHKAPYTVIRGDALAKIATKTKSGAELIYVVNDLQTINLQIGQELQIPELDIRVAINRAEKTLTVTNHGKFFREYPLIGATIPRLADGTTLEAAVTDKIATVNGKRVAFGDKTYGESERSVLLGPGGAVIRTPPAQETNEALPSGILMAPEDFREVFVLLSRGTPVTIH